MTTSQARLSVRCLCAVTVDHSEARIFDVSVMKVSSVTRALGLMATIAPITHRMTHAPAMRPRPCMTMEGISMNMAPMNSNRPTARDAR